MREKREFNFAQRWEEKNQKPASGLFGLQASTLGWAAGGTLLVMALASAPWLWEYKLQSDLSQINAKINELQDVDTLWQDVKSLQKQVQNQTELQRTMQKNARDPSLLWDRLQRMFPPGTMVNSFSFQSDNSVSMAVSVPSPVAAAQLWVSLRDSNLFQDIDIQNLSLQDKVQTLNLNLKLKGAL